MDKITVKNFTELKLIGCVCLIFLFTFAHSEASRAYENENYGTDYYDPSTHSDPGTQIIVHTAAELLQTATSAAGGNVTVLIEDGTYDLDSFLNITGNNVTYRSRSGNRDSVILRGKLGSDGSMLTSHIFQVSGNNFRVQDLSLGRVYYHGIQIHGENSASYMHVKNVRFFDIKEQMIKGTFNTSAPDIHSDYGVVENCLFEYTAGVAYQYYCGGVDVHRGKNWIIRDNIFRNITSPTSNLTEGAVHFWNQAQGTIVERNKIINCDRGIMFGMDNSPHTGGIIRNNFVQAVVDTGIYLCDASGAKVYNNTVFITSTYPNAIEYRYTPVNGVAHVITNNLCNRSITLRNGGIATVQNNVVNAQSTWFVDTAAGDLHLIETPASVISKAIDLNEVRVDIDRQLRTTGKSDLGADQKKIAPAAPTGVTVRVIQ